MKIFHLTLSNGIMDSTSRDFEKKICKIEKMSKTSTEMLLVKTFRLFYTLLFFFSE